MNVSKPDTTVPKSGLRELLAWTLELCPKSNLHINAEQGFERVHTRRPAKKWIFETVRIHNKKKKNLQFSVWYRWSQFYHNAKQWIKEKEEQITVRIYQHELLMLESLRRQKIQTFCLFLFYVLTGSSIQLQFDYLCVSHNCSLG